LVLNDGLAEQFKVFLQREDSKTAGEMSINREIFSPALSQTLTFRVPEGAQSQIRNQDSPKTPH
jgi:hypothetical protein